MDKDNKNEFDLWHCGSYSNGNWKGCILRWVLGAIILIIVFVCGFKVGKYYMIFSGGYYGGGYYNSPMMGGNYYRGTMQPENYYGSNGYYYSPE